MRPSPDARRREMSLRREQETERRVRPRRFLPALRPHGADAEGPWWPSTRPSTRRGLRFSRGALGLGGITAFIVSGMRRLLFVQGKTLPRHRGCARRTPPWETARAKGAQGLGCSARRPAHPGALGGWGLGLSPQPRTHYVTSQGLAFLKLGKRWHPRHKGVVRAGRAHPFSALGPERVVSPG